MSFKELLGVKKTFTAEDDYIQLYDKEPSNDISINDLIEFAYYRSQCHQEINDLENGIEKKEQFERILTKYGIPIRRPRDGVFNPSNSNMPNFECGPVTKQFLDEMSFYSFLIISLRSDETQHKFVKIESDIFRARIRYALDTHVKLHEVDGEQFKFPKELLQIPKPELDLNQYYNHKKRVYSIPFELIFEFINVYTCNLEDGYVEVAPTELDSFFTKLYQIYLEKKIARYRSMKVHSSDLTKIAITMFDERAGSFVAKTRQNFGRVTLSDMEAVIRSFPPCMRSMYDALKRNHKLFHAGRLQFGLYLKGIGLTMDESLKFWRSEFTKAISLDDFEKHYAYNIRHTYGKEGAGKNLSAYSCAGILKQPSPASGQTHGCPFKMMQLQQLEALIKEINPEIPGKIMAEINAKARENPGVACALLFNSLHPDHELDETGVFHPNVYFNESEERYIQKDKKQ